MAKTILQTSGGQASTANTDQYWYLVGGTNPRSVEANAGLKIRATGNFSNLFCKLSANSVAATSTFTLRKNATTDGTNVLSIGSSATGDFEDTTHTDASAAADTWALKTHPGAATGTYTIEIISILFDATTNTVTIFNNSGTPTFSTASTSFFLPLTGNVAGTNGTQTEANCKVRMRKAGTFKNMGIKVATNRATTSTGRMRKNSGNGNIAVSITGGGASGWYEDTSNTDTVAAGEDWNFSVTTGTGADNLVFDSCKVEWESTAGNGILATTEPVTGIAIVDNTTRFSFIGGLLTTDSTETGAGGVQTKSRAVFTFSELTCLVSANTASNVSTITLREDATDTTLVCSITADGTGVFSDTTHTYTSVAADLLSYEITVPNESGTNTLTLRNITISTQSPNNFTRTMETETTTISESISRLLAATRNPQETTNMGENLTRMLSATRLMSTETVTINDGGIVQSVHGYVRTMATEIVNIGESLLHQLTANRSLPESVSIGENLTRKLDAIRTLPESIIIEDTITRMLAATRAIATESIVIGENLVRLLAAQRIIEDTTAVLDNLTRMLSATRTSIENISVGDSLTRMLEAFRTIGQTTSISDLLETLFQSGGGGNQNYTRTITEDTSISDQLSRMLEAFRTSSDTTVVDESINRTYSASRTISEDVSIIDSLSLQLSAFRTLLENVGITDQLERKLDSFRTIIETTSISDLLEHLKQSADNQNFVRTLVENVSVSDSVKTLLSAIKLFKSSIGNFASEGIRTVRKGRILSPNRWRNSFYTYTHTRDPEHSEKQG